MMSDTPKPRNTQATRSGAGAVLGYGTLLTLLIPLLCFYLVALLNGMDSASAIRALQEQCTQHRQNPLLTSILALLPVYVFAALLWIVNRRRAIAHPRIFAATGISSAAAVQLWVNWNFWDLFLPSRAYPGFPHGLEFVIGPLFFTPIAMVFGVLVVVLSLRVR